VAAQLLLWTAIGLMFGPMAARLLESRTRDAPAAPVTQPAG
jgi:hypothetical protein